VKPEKRKTKRDTSGGGEEVKPGEGGEAIDCCKER